MFLNFGTMLYYILRYEINQKIVLLCFISIKNSSHFVNYNVKGNKNVDILSKWYFLLFDKKFLAFTCWHFFFLKSLFGNFILFFIIVLFVNMNLFFVVVIFYPCPTYLHANNLDSFILIYEYKGVLKSRSIHW